ncbi:hypothetical protein RvY_13731-1 [Ramazzottius varieornatus]|uniref:Uncharacterized protein n=1 Tax=Ramazzottius varieornatus TaxID=947166 RepID=A0A1D1VNX8_RAMVA|nr:hypothetical protein RvY_13731-1 [Ramazzottius varieornatus]
MELSIDCTQPPPISVWELEESTHDSQSEGWQSAVDIHDDDFQRIISTQDDADKTQTKISPTQDQVVKCAVLRVARIEPELYIDPFTVVSKNDAYESEVRTEKNDANSTLNFAKTEEEEEESGVKLEEVKNDSDEESIYLSLPADWSSQSGQIPSELDGQEEQGWWEEDEASQGSEEAEPTDLNFSLKYRHELDSGDRTSLSLPLDEYENLCDKLYDENRSYQRYDPAYEGFTSFQSFRAPLLDSTRFSGAGGRPQLSRSNSFRSGADVLNGSFRIVKKNREPDTSKKAEFLENASHGTIFPIKKVPRKMPPSPKEKSPPRKTKRFNFSDNLFASIDPELTKLMSSGKGTKGKAVVRRRKVKPTTVPSYLKKSSIVVEDFDDGYSRD